MIEQCPACGSRRLVRSLRVASEVLRSPSGAFAPGGPLNRGQSAGDLRAVVCVDCGVLQWHVVDLDKLAALYAEQQAGSLQLG